MSFIPIIPCEQLKPYVKLFAIGRNEKAGSYNVLPDTSIVMGFQFSGKLSYTHRNEQIGLSKAGITGLRDTYRTFSNTEHTGTVLVMFNETGAAAFFNHAMNELFDQSLALDDLILRSQMNTVSEQLNEAETDAAKINVIERFLLSRLNPAINDQMVSLAVNLIRQSQGLIRISVLAQELNISQSRLEKRFRAIVGASPKKFASIVRVRNVLNSPTEIPSLTGLAIDAGYFDQSHFIRAFKSFTGQTPEQYFKK